MPINWFDFNSSGRKFFGLEVAPKQVAARVITGLLASAVIFGGQLGYSKINGSEQSVDTTMTAESVAIISEPATDSSASTQTTDFSTDPNLALVQLKRSISARDASTISSTLACGKWVVLITENSLRFFEWVDSEWTDRSNLISTDEMGVGPTRKILSVDLTDDDSTDFMITFENEKFGGSPVGAIFAKDSNVSSCAWNWMYFSEPEGTNTKTRVLLNYNSSSRILTGTDPAVENGSTVEYKYDHLFDSFRVNENGGFVSDDDAGVIGSFMDDLASWRYAGFRSMFYKAADQSPAQQYAKHLLLGRQAEIEAGLTEPNEFQVIRKGTLYKLCIDSACSYEFYDFLLDNGRVSTFSVNGLELSKLLRTDLAEPSPLTQCPVTDVCITLRSVFQSFLTVYVAFEVNCVNASDSTTFVQSKLNTLNTIETKKSAIVTACSHGDTKHWGLSFATTANPFGGSVSLRISNAGVAKSLIFAIPA